jgi:hypothetical protein
VWLFQHWQRCWLLHLSRGAAAGCCLAVWLSGCSFWLLCVSGCRTREGRSRRLRTRLRGAEDVSTFEIGVARCTQLLWWTTPKVSSWCALARRVGKALSVCCWINGSATASPRLSYAFAEAIGGAKTFVVNHNDIMNTVLPPCTVHSNWPASLAVQKGPKPKAAALCGRQSPAPSPLSPPPLPSPSRSSSSCFVCARAAATGSSSARWVEAEAHAVTLRRAQRGRSVFERGRVVAIEVKPIIIRG